MGEQSAARIEGDDYQHLLSWYHLLELLDEQAGLDHAWLEHPAAGAADDLTLHPLHPNLTATRYYQVKWHVDHRSQYSIDLLLHTERGTTSLLHKLWRSWQRLSSQGPVELWLVSNWAADEELGSLIDGRKSYLKEIFLNPSRGSTHERQLSRCQHHLQATPDDFAAFYRTLRFRLGFASISDLQTMVDDRMQARGVIPGPATQALAVTQIRTWIALGKEQKRITPDILRAFLASHHLWQTSINRQLPGHQAQRLTDNSGPLSKFYLAPDEVFERVQLNNFVGRTWLESDLDAFFNDPNTDRGVWLLVGEAGVGKTSFLAHLVQERNYIHVFAEQAPGDTNLVRALQSIAAQLIDRFQLDSSMKDQLLANSMAPDYLGRLLRMSAEQLSEGERLVLVADGLDC